MKFSEIFNPYFYVVKLRNFLYAKKILTSYSPRAFIISVGNLSCGGTGKTSLVRHLGERLSKDFQVGILFKGYKAKGEGPFLLYSPSTGLKGNPELCGDEAFATAFYFFKRKIPSFVVMSKDRVKGVNFLEKLGRKVILLDDAFQHLKIKRDLDIVLLKKKDIHDRLLPFGRLREPISHLKRAHVIGLSYQEVEPFEFCFENKPVFKIFRKKWKIFSSNLEKAYSIEEFKKMVSSSRLVAFCGLGENRQFLKILEKLKISPDKFLAFPDHYTYRDFDLGTGDYYLTTLKDGVKLSPSSFLFFLDFEIEDSGLTLYVKNLLKKAL